MNSYRTIIHKPIVTEKATILREGNKYTFRVDRRANKIQIRKAIEAIFDVRVKSVCTVSVPGKPKRQGAFEGRCSSWKKAYVTLREGDVIDVLDAA
jgi:large subunit ribosomal protein L23